MPALYAFWVNAARDLLGVGFTLLASTSVVFLPGVAASFSVRRGAPDLRAFVCKSFLCAGMLAAWFCIIAVILLHTPVQWSFVRWMHSGRFVDASCLITAAVWIGAATCIWIWTAAGCVSLLKLRQDSAPLADGDLALLVSDLSSKFGLAIPELRAHAWLQSPYIARLGRCVLFVPAMYQLIYAPEELRILLTRELRHVQRRDFEWNLVFWLFAALLWPQPLVWILYQQWKEAALEQCQRLDVDDGAPANTGQVSGRRSVEGVGTANEAGLLFFQ